MGNNVIEPPTEDDDWMFGQEIYQVEKILQKEIIAQVMIVLEGMSVRIDLDEIDLLDDGEATISICPWPNCATFVDIPLKKLAGECAAVAIGTGDAKNEEWKKRMREALAPILEILEGQI